MAIIKFGPKKKYIVVPDGFVIIKSAKDNNVIFTEFENYKHEVVFYADRFLNLYTGTFNEITNEDFKDIDGNEIPAYVNDYALIIRDKRRMNDVGIEYYSDDVVLDFDELNKNE